MPPSLRPVPPPPFQFIHPLFTTTKEVASSAAALPPTDFVRMMLPFFVHEHLTSQPPFSRSLQPRQYQPTRAPFPPIHSPSPSNQRLGQTLLPLYHALFLLFLLSLHLFPPFPLPQLFLQGKGIPRGQESG